MEDEYAILSDSDQAEQRKRANFQKKKKCRIISIMILICVLSITFVTFLRFNWFTMPSHASCKVKLNWSSTDCTTIKQSIVNQIKNWTTRDNCLNGGQKCLYTLLSEDANSLKATHTTPVKAYVDTLTFSFETSNISSCTVDVNILK